MLHEKHSGPKSKSRLLFHAAVTTETETAAQNWSGKIEGLVFVRTTSRHLKSEQPSNDSRSRHGPTRQAANSTADKKTTEK